MKAKTTIFLVSALAAVSLVATGCGSGGGSTTAPAEATSTASGAGGGEGQETGGGAAPSEAQAAASGDIPDNQVFLVFHDPKAGYSIRYPEGWARTGAGNDVTFREKANTVHIAVHNGAPRGKSGTKTTYARMSAPDPVTGKRLRLLTDRYEYGNQGKVAVLDLATPEGVDNVDAYRTISESFEWLR